MRDVPRSHPQAEGAVLTTLRAPCLFLRSKVVILRAPCLFLLQCKVEYKTHVRLESGDESPHSKVDIGRHRAGQVNMAFELLPVMAFEKSIAD